MSSVSTIGLFLNISLKERNMTIEAETEGDLTNNTGDMFPLSQDFFDVDGMKIFLSLLTENK